MTPRILIIDCEPESRERVREQLMPMDSKSVLQRMVKAPFGLSRNGIRSSRCSTSVLGAESGLDLLRHLLELRRSLTTILVSAYPGYRDDFTAWLADAFLNKSPDLEELKSKIHELLPTAPAA
jgi:DNA-binding NtrC family response regulator